MLFCCFEVFMWKFTENFSFLSKKWLSLKRATEILRKFVFLTMFEGGNPEANLDLFKQLFLIKPVKGDKYYKKTIFLPKLSHIQLNYAFLLFWSIFGEIQREILVLVKKVTISETSTEILWKLVFLTMFEKWQIQWKIWVSLNKCFWSNQ